MQHVKLLAAPALFSIARQSRYRNLLCCPIGGAESLPGPFLIDDRIAKRTTVWRADFATIVKTLVRVVVTTGAGGERRFTWIEFRSAMFRMTGNATDSGRSVRFNDRCYEAFRVVARSTIPFHAARERMTVGTGIRVRLRRDRRENAQL